MIDRLQIGVLTLLTMGGLTLTAAFVADGWLGRLEGVVLVSSWALATWIVVRTVPGSPPEAVPRVAFRSHWAQSGVVLGALALVGLGATVAVRARSCGSPSSPVSPSS